MNSEKQQLRERMREEATRYSATERVDWSSQICERVQKLEAWQNAKSVLLFVPTTYEPDISPLMNTGKRVSLPRFNEQRGQYEACQVSGELVAGRFGILEPGPNCVLVTTLDVVVAPGVAFALDGSRLGRGKGFYDRLLAQLEATKVGVCFDWQIVQTIPRDIHDVLMNHIVTPTSSS